MVSSAKEMQALGKTPKSGGQQDGGRPRRVGNPPLQLHFWHSSPRLPCEHRLLSQARPALSGVRNVCSLGFVKEIEQQRNSHREPSAYGSCWKDRGSGVRGPRRDHRLHGPASELRSSIRTLPPASHHAHVTGPGGAWAPAAAPTHSSLPTGSFCLVSAFPCEPARAAFPKGHELHGLKTEIYSPAVLEAGSLKSSCWRGQGSSGWSPSLPPPSFWWWPAVLGDPCRIGLGPTLMTSS